MSALQAYVRETLLTVLGFNPDQPRDESGRWTGGDTPGTLAKEASWAKNLPSIAQPKGVISGEVTAKSGTTFAVVRSENTYDGNVVPKVEYAIYNKVTGAKIGSAELRRGKEAVSAVGIDSQYRRQGLATALYKHIEKDLGHSLKPNDALTDDGQAFWNYRSRNLSVLEAASFLSDKDYKKRIKHFAVAIRYAFARGRSVLRRTKDAGKTAKAVEKALREVLPEALRKASRAGEKEALKSLGGPGSGNFGHAGRPGEVGGSASADGGAAEGDGGTNRGGSSLSPNSLDPEKAAALVHALFGAKSVLPVDVVFRQGWDYLGDTKTSGKAPGAIKEETVLLNSLIPTQERVKMARLLSVASIGAFTPINVDRREGKLYVTNGHHRAALGLLAGHSTIRATVRDFDVVRRAGDKVSVVARALRELLPDVVRKVARLGEKEALKGLGTSERDYVRDEIGRFAPVAGHTAREDGPVYPKDTHWGKEARQTYKDMRPGSWHKVPQTPHGEPGLYKAGDTIGMPKGGLLASFTDPEGCTISVHAPRQPLEHDRVGIFRIAPPGGKPVNSGFWMDFTEREWKISNRVYRSQSPQQRAAMEALQQASGYQSLRDQYEDAFNNHSETSEMRRDYRKLAGLESSDLNLEHAKDWAEKHAFELATNLSKTSREAIQDALAHALEEQKKNPDMAFEGLFEDVLEAVGDETRAMLIAETEVMNALNHGKRAAWDEMAESGEISKTAKRKWVTYPGCCDECDALDGETAQLGDTYDDGSYGPPLHPRCRCTEELVEAPSYTFSV